MLLKAPLRCIERRFYTDDPAHFLFHCKKAAFSPKILKKADIAAVIYSFKENWVK
jgi:hypothetical protein